MAVTIGMKDILASGRIRRYRFDAVFQPALFRIALTGEVSVHYPVTFVQERPTALSKRIRPQPRRATIS